MANRFFPNYNTYKITSKFGMRTLNGKTAMHNGIDLVARANNGGSRTDSITAHTGGTVDGAGYDSSAGNFLRIKVANNVFMSYFHMRDKVAFKKGDSIKKGQVIGYMGSTGNSTGAHLHFGIKDNGKWINPEPYLDKDYVKIVTSKKTNEEIAKEVIAGKWGNGTDRKKKLEAAGYNYSEVQSKVNALCGKTAAPSKKSNEEIAREVIQGKWGNGATRKKKLTAAGYNYSDIQKIVNKLL